VLFTGLSVFVDNAIISSILGVIGCSCFWSIKELFEQKRRVKKGGFPKIPTEKKNNYIKIKGL